MFALELHVSKITRVIRLAVALVSLGSRAPQAVPAQPASDIEKLIEANSDLNIWRGLGVRLEFA